VTCSTSGAPCPRPGGDDASSWASACANGSGRCERAVDQLGRRHGSKATGRPRAAPTTSATRRSSAPRAGQHQLGRGSRLVEQRVHGHGAMSSASTNPTRPSPVAVTMRFSSRSIRARWCSPVTFCMNQEGLSTTKSCDPFSARPGAPPGGPAAIGVTEVLRSTSRSTPLRRASSINGTIAGATSMPGAGRGRRAAASSADGHVLAACQSNGTSLLCD